MSYKHTKIKIGLNKYLYNKIGEEFFETIQLSANLVFYKLEDSFLKHYICTKYIYNELFKTSKICIH